jgi:NTP pyrophosphatase (non-canonical NTP hydrolase)
MTNLTEYNQFVARVFAQRGQPVGSKDVFEASLGLASEAGEVAGKFAKYLRGDYANNPDKNILVDVQLELGDVCFFLCMLHQALGLSLEMTMEKNITKLESRIQRGVVQGNGDTR